MSSFKHEECVEILQCNVFETNLVQGQGNSCCWEMARQMKDFRFTYNICQDCIAYLFAQEEGVLTQNEMEHILSQRNITCHTKEHTA